MSTIVVGIADCQVSRSEEASLVTYALGSCIGLAIFDPQTHVGGLLHLMLPTAAGDPESAKNVYRYADTGVPLLFQEAYRLGARKERLVVRMAGGASVCDVNNVFNIGQRNHAAVRKLLWQAGVLVAAEAVGGSECRTVRLDLREGKFWVRGPREREWELTAAQKQAQTLQPRAQAGMMQAAIRRQNGAPHPDCR